MSKSKNNFATKALRHQEKKTAEIILAAIILFLATEAQSHKGTNERSQQSEIRSQKSECPIKLIDISAPGSAAICSAAESFFQQGSNSVISYQLSAKKNQSRQSSQSTPLCAFSFPQSGNFLTEILDADYADLRRGQI